MAEKRREGFKKTLTGSSTERRRQSAESVRKEKREKAMQLKRRRVMEDWDAGGGEAQMGAAEEEEWTPESVQAAITTFHQVATAAGKGQVGPVLDSTRRLRRLLCLPDPPTVGALYCWCEGGEMVAEETDFINDAGASEELKLEVIWCLTNIAAGTHEETRSVVQAVPYLITFILPGPSESLKEQTCWFLGNIAADGTELRAILHANGAVPVMVKILRESTKVSLRSTCAWALSHLAKGSDTSAKPFVDAGLLPVVADILRQAASEEESLVKEVAWITAFLTTREDEYVTELVRLGVADSLGAILSSVAQSSMSLSVGTPVLRGLANIVAGGEPSWAHAVLRQEAFLPSLRAFLANQHVAETRALVKEALWAIANVSGIPEAVQAILTTTDIMSLVVNYLKSGQFDMQRESLFAIYNVIVSSPQHLEALIQSQQGGVLPTLLVLLKVPDEEVVGCSLSLLHLVVKNVPGGAQLILDLNAEVIENLQYGAHHEKIKAQASQIVDLLYEEDEADDLSDGGGVGGGGFTFLPPSGAVDSSSSSGAAAAAAGRGRGKHLNVPAWQAR